MMKKIFLLTGSLIVLTMSNKALCQSRETTPQVLEKGIAAGKMEGLSEEFCTELLNAIHKESLGIEEELWHP
jgi:hypothetical protein